MTEAEKLLQETKSAVVADAQTEDICIIDSNLRIASIPESFKVLGVEHDKDVRVVQFRMPKLYKNIDLSTFAISVNYQNANGIKDRYLVTDKNVSSDYIEFSWTVGSAATKYKGDTKFIVCMRMIGTEGIIEKEFNTTLATMTVLEGLEVDNPVIEQEEKDIIAQLLQIVDDKCKETVQAVTAEGTKQIKAVQDAAKEAVKNEAEEAVRETVQESIDTITEETEKQKELIVAEGTKQIERVAEEGTKQVEIVQDAAQEIVADREQIQTNKQDIADLQSYIGYYEDEHVVGLQVDYKNKTFKRLAGAKYLKPGADFNKYKMFGGRRKCIVDDAGKIVAWHGDSKYVEDGSTGQVMVYQPAFYYRVQPLDLEPIDTGIGHHLRKANYYVSDIPLPGFKRHPSFFDANGDEIDYTLTSAYEGNIFAAEDSNLLTDGEQEITNNEYSIKAYTPAIPLSEGVEYEVSVCVTPGKGVEKLCHYLSDGYILMAETPMVGNEKQTVTAKFVAKYYDGKKPENDLKYAKYCIFKNSNNVAITEPTTIHWVKIKRAVSNSYLKKDEQVANFDTDKLSSIAGVKPASGVKQKLTRANAEKLANNRGTGWYIDTIKSVSAEQLLMMIEMGTMNMQDAIGEGVVNIADNTSYNCSSITGSTASIGNGTGQAAQTVNTKGDASTTETADGKTSVCWRGKENFWGNIWKFVYGINIWGNGKMGGGQPYICKDFNFVENKNSDNYEGAGFTATNANGYISAMGYSTNYDWLFIASECLGNSLLPVGDYTDTDNNLNGYNIAISDGGWNFGDFAGAFCWYLAGGADYRVRDIGGRIIHIPTKGSEPYKSNIVSWKQEVSK